MSGGDLPGGPGTEGRIGRVLALRGWPLLAVLAVQAALSLQLIWANTAFQDEGLYLWAGHLELAHLLRQAPVPDFATYFSGSPLIYPTVGAAADSLGGLAAARLLSLAFMLTTTVALHGVTRRLFGSRASAFFAAALFAGLGPAQFIGAFATYDAMALALLAAATWLGVRAASARPASRTALIVVSALVLALANATKYASALFDPVVVAVTTLTLWRLHGRAAALRAGAGLTGATILVLAAAYRLGGAPYAQGISYSTLGRAAGTDPALTVLSASARWTGAAAVLGVLGAAAIWGAWRSVPARALAGTLAAAVFLAPLQQARIHTEVSLFKHVGYGAWFASAAGGYLLAALPQAAAALNGARVLRAAIGVVAAAAAAGYLVAAGQFGSWPNARVMTAAISSLSRPGGRYLAEDYGVPAYYLRRVVRWQQWSNTFNFGYTDPVTGRYLQNGPAYADAIRAQYFTVIVLAFGDTEATDRVITADLRRYGGYRLTSVLPYRTRVGRGTYRIWTLVSPAGQ